MLVKHLIVQNGNGYRVESNWINHTEYHDVQDLIDKLPKRISERETEIAGQIQVPRGFQVLCFEDASGRQLNYLAKTVEDKFSLLPAAVASELKEFEAATGLIFIPAGGDMAANCYVGIRILNNKGDQIASLSYRQRSGEWKVGWLSVDYDPLPKRTDDIEKIAEFFRKRRI